MFSWILFVDLQNNALCLVLLAWNAECVEKLVHAWSVATLLSS